ncbi:MAG TPA: carboxypeptidase regulatory-like domain-containing protein [Candidatus Limnocylindrales bacterium]|nr:carboxypeptidase regulatory-like domain-containing protein [Candidatus Limnocylindrales bacterium]
MRASVLGLTAVLSACGPNPNGQGVTDTGSVVGTIVDAKTPTVAINSATVQIGLQVTRLSTSDQGKFTMSNVPTGTQTIVISSPGYQTYSSQVIVRKGQTSDIGVIGLASATGL